MAGGQGVQPGGGDVDLAEQLRAAELGHAHADGVAVALRRQTADGNPLDLGELALDRLVVVELPAHDVRVHAGAADLLADPVDQQHVDPRRTAAAGISRLASTSSSLSRASNCSGGTASMRAVWS